MTDRERHPKKTWFVYDANGPLFSWSPTMDTKENIEKAYDYLKKRHPELYKKAVVGGNEAHYLEMVHKLQDATLSGELAAHPNKRMINLAHKIREYGGSNMVISDGDKSFLVDIMHKVSEGNPPFDEENIISSLSFGRKKNPQTWYTIFQKMGVHKGDRFYGVEDTEKNARAMAEAAKESGLIARVYLLDNSIPAYESRREGNIERIGSPEHLEKKMKRFVKYHTKKQTPNKRDVISVFFVSLSPLSFL